MNGGIFVKQVVIGIQYVVTGIGGFLGWWIGECMAFGMY